MPKIDDIDKNFKVSDNVKRDNIVFRSVEESPFKIYGVTKENGFFRRMPEEIAQSVSEGVYILHTNTAGGRVRFVTDSEYVAIHTVMGNLGKMSHFALSGSIGFDLYDSAQYIGTFVPPFDISEGYDSVIDFDGRKRREITINFPLYSDVKELYIGLDKAASLTEAAEYKIKKPIVYYGSSITQGGCASRPGCAYQSILSRRFDCDFINLGFSGSAKGEKAAADYIAGLDMSLFVLDYDHNAPTAEHLQATHESFFRIIREQQPDLPIIMMSRPKYYLTDDEKKRRDVVKATYENAVERGDKNVYFIDGSTLMNSEVGADGTVDNCHPTDLGFFSMAQRIAPLFSEILK